MKSVPIAGLTVRPTVIGFGCSALMGAGNVHARRLLTAAYDSGIRHFDVAPLYGRGDAEGALGEFLRSRRDGVTIATKFGLSPRSLSTLSRLTLSAGRAAIAVAPGVRQAMHRFARQLQVQRSTRSFEPKRFSIDVARRALDRSLRALRTDYVDIYLLHEYEPSDEQNETMLRFLEDSVGSGRVLRFGVGSTFSRALKVLEVAPELCGVVQFESSVVYPNLARLRDVDARLLITYGAVSSSLGIIARYLKTHPTEAQAMAKLIGLDVQNSSILARLMLASAVRENRDGIVLFSSTQPEHILSNVRAVDGELTTDQILAFEQAIDNRRIEIAAQ